MRRENIDRSWSFVEGVPASGAPQNEAVVNLPHDFTIKTDVAADAPGKSSTGYYKGGIGTYTKMLDIPEDLKGKRILIEFDGVHMNAVVSLNGQVVKRHSFGYSPFHADITQYARHGKVNRLTVTVNNSAEPNSRWYAGSGIYRHIDMLVSEKVHISPWGVFAYLSHIVGKTAFVKVETTVENHTAEAANVWVDTVVSPCGEETCGTGRTKVYVPACGSAKTTVLVKVPEAKLWDLNSPNLYCAKATVSDINGELDSQETTFGIRTISVDPENGFMLNGRSLKLKGGCVHHDNGLIGASSFYASEYRKIERHIEGGFNAIRTAHNPPSRDLLEACDKLGVLVMDEAFDCWLNGKNPYDYATIFETDWQSDMESFILRDRNHPSIVMWSTGNEIIERGGLSEGYLWADKLASFMRSVDPTRYITNGVCSFWSGLEDDEQKKMMEEMMKAREGGATAQNMDTSYGVKIWGDFTEAFVSPLDIVGYNYLDSRYAFDGKNYPNRVICGTESFPKMYDKVWAEVEKHPHVIGDFTWTSYDYIGEAGVGKSAFMPPETEDSPYLLSSQTSVFPWRLANDADFDILGNARPQLAFRRIIWGSDETYIAAQNPKYHDLKEIISMWGFRDVNESWTWDAAGGTPIKVTVFSGADEVELIINGKSAGVAAAGKENRYTAEFDVPYSAGCVEAVSRTEGKEISRAALRTVGKPAEIVLVPEKTEISADGQDLCYVHLNVVDSDGNIVPNAEVMASATVTGAAELIGFGSANPVTSENYAAGSFTSFNGRLLAILRPGYEPGTATLTVKSSLGETCTNIAVR